MFLYLALFAYFAIAAIYGCLSQRQNQRDKLWITAVILITLIGFRWHVGADWNGYKFLLQSSYAGQQTYVTQRAEPGYAVLNSIAALANWDLWFPNLVCAIIFTYGLIAFCRQQPNPWLGLAVATPYLIICVAMGYTRQSAALGLIMLALAQFTRKSQLAMFTTLGLAATFHASAIAVPPLFALAAARRGFVTGVLLVAFGIALYFAVSQRIAMRISAYHTISYIATGAVPRILMNLLPACIFLLARRRFTDSPEELRLWTIISLVIFLTIPMLFLVSSSTIVDRIGIYLAPLQIFVLTRLPLVFGQNRRQNFILVLVIVLYALAAEVVWLNFGKEARAWIPYRNYVWEQVLAADA